jgi:IclR helix-turn-helix domain
MGDWRLLSNHGRVLVFVARQPHARLRDIADAAGITERTAHRIVSELGEDGYLVRQRHGRSNHYVVRPDVPIRDPLLGEHWVGEILAVLAGTDGWPARGGAARESGRRAGWSASGFRRAPGGPGVVASPGTIVQMQVGETIASRSTDTTS